MTPYPPRPKLYAIHYIEWLIRSGTIKDTDPSVFGILVAVAMAEDRIFYERAPNFYNRQLADDSAIGSEPALIRARSRAIDAGLLHYEPGAKRRPGRYFTLGFPNELIGKAKGCVRESGGKAKPSIPIPFPNPIPKEEDAASGESPPNSSREKKTPFHPLKVTLPDPLKTARFADAWAKWCQHRREIRKPLTPTATGQQIKRLAGMGEQRAVAAIEHTVAMGWTGLREPDGASTRNGSPSGSAPKRAKPMRTREQIEAEDAIR